MFGSNASSKGAMLALMSFALFSTHDLIVKWLGEFYAPTQIMFFSVLFGFPLLTLMLVRQSKAATLRPRYPIWTVLRTIAVVTTGACAFFAFSQLPMAEVYALLFAQPLLITLLAIPILGESIGWIRRIAILVGLCGVLVVLRPGPSGLTIAHAAAALAACSGAFASIIVRKIGREERSAVLLVYPMLTNFLVMGASLFFFYEPMPVVHMAGSAAVAVLGFAGMSCLILAYRFGTAASVAPMQYSQMLWAILYGAIFFSERPDTATLIGSVIIISSGAIILWREGGKGVSENQPVLNTRSRPETGLYPRVGPMMRRGMFRGQSPDE